MSSKQSGLERRFETLWYIIGGPELISEYRFHPKRRWRFDFAHPETMVAIECEGGIWNDGRHTRGIGYSNDCQKYNAAQLLGWRVFRLTGPMLNKPKNLEQIKEFIEAQC